MRTKRTEISRLKQRLREAASARRDLDKRMFHLKTLYDLSREVGFLIDTEAIMKNLLLMVIGTFGTFRGVIVLLDRERRLIKGLHHRGLDEETVATLTRMVESEVDIGEALDALNLALWIPFSVNTRLAGGIGLGEKMTGDAYAPDDRELLSTVANQAAVAIRNACAHEEVVRYAAELEESLARIKILESIKGHLAKFVPKTVQTLIEESPEAPSLDKREIDVSVLFADITGYARISAQLDLERVNQLVEVYFGTFLDEILKRGGDVNETAGDGIMVIFRDPDPRQHAAAAVRAALAIQRRAQEINATLEGFFEPVAMHVAVNSGVAAVGVTKIEGATGTRWTYTASGPTTNVAARLAALAKGGSVILGEETRRRLGDEFEIEDLGPQSLKNVLQPVRAYRLVCAGP